MKGRVMTLCVFFVLYIIILGGCKNNHSRVQPNPAFKAAFIAEYRDLSIKGRVVSTRQGNFNLTVSQPKTLEGLEYGFKNGTVSLGRQNVSCTADEAYLPSSAFPEQLREILKGIADGRAVFESENNGQLFYRLDCCGECKITTGSDGMIKQISRSNPKLSISFDGTEVL